AGSKTLIANLGFLLTAVGLPFLGILAMSLTNSSGVHDLSSKVGKRYADVFTILLYAIIGPFFAMPRLATISFVNGIKPHVSKSSSTIILLLYSILFFGIAYFFSRKPSNLMDYVGKWLNPACLLLLGVLLVLALVNPLGAVSDGAILGDYKAIPFVQGLKDGYSTMDVLASLAFGIIVISTLKNLGVKKPKEITVGALKSGLVVVFLMAVIYTAMSFMGATSLGYLKPAENGAIALSQLSKHYLGGFGSLLFALIVILVTLKTTTGLVVAIGEATVDFNKKIPYQTAIIVISILPMIFANAGLDLIFQWSTPVLMFIYPLAITLVLMALLEPLVGYRKPVYVWTTVFAIFAAVFDALNAMPDGVKEFGLVKSLLNIGSHLPLFAHGIGWLVPSLIGFAAGFLLSKKAA
ncbi:MAG: branched-chain amino acid transport system II carrier protein, partial [Streptococcaceae bacterium]|nr:branched-chain amino acid transport system II carrier protein [Streptococcaceae bacterium]